MGLFYWYDSIILKLLVRKMYLFGVFLLVVIAYFMFFKKKPINGRPSSKAVETKRVKEDNGKQGAINFDNPIPIGYQIFAKNIPVAGMSYRKNDVINFSRTQNQELTIKRELNNQHDKNAIQLIGISGSNQYIIGYLPKELSEQIISTGLFDSIKVRLTRIYIGREDFIEVHYQIIGPKADKKQFDDFVNNKPADSSQKEYFKFFGLTSPKGMTAGHAEQTIKEHKKTSTDEEQGEWFGYTSIFEEFDDADFRETYELKKVSKTILLEVLNQLKQENKTYSYLGDNIDEVVERVIQLKPELERKM